MLRRSRHVSLRRSTPILSCSFGKQELPASQEFQRMPINSSMSSSSDTALPSSNPFKFFQDALTAMKGDTETTALKLQIRPAVFVVSIIAVLAASTVMTLIFSTQGVTKGYTLRDLQFKRQALVRENEVMTMQLSQAQSLNAVVTNDILLYMRPPQRIIHMAGSSAIASR